LTRWTSTTIKHTHYRGFHRLLDQPGRLSFSLLMLTKGRAGSTIGIECGVIQRELGGGRRGCSCRRVSRKWWHHGRRVIASVFLHQLLLLHQQMVTERRGCIPTGREHERRRWVWVRSALSIDVRTRDTLLALKRRHRVVIVEGRE
jgi:hypothetical protein